MEQELATSAQSLWKLGSRSAVTQSALQPLIPYLDTMRWLFIVVALIGIGTTIYARWDDWRKGRG